MNFRSPSRIIIGSVLALGLALAGCGGSSSRSSAPKTATTSQAGVSKAESLTTHPQLHRPSGANLATTIAVGTPAVSGKAELPSRYTCDGHNTSLPITWGTVPPHTAEIALFLITAVSVQGKLGLTAINWALTNLKPSAHGISAGGKPSGAVLGSNEPGSKGYSICPPKGSPGSFAVLLYALPHRLPTKPGYNAAAVRVQAADSALAGGSLVFSYTRH